MPNRYGYNDIRNDNWFTRLVSRVNAGTMRDIQATGSEADDPYFKAKRNEAVTDLSNARAEAFRGESERGLAGMAADNAQEAYRQRVISAAMARDWKPDQMLGVQADNEAGGPSLSPAAPLPDSATAPASPAAYAAPMSGAPRAQGSAGAFRPFKYYDPGQFANTVLERRKRGLDSFYANLSRNPVY